MKAHIKQTSAVMLLTIFGCQPTPPLAPISVEYIVDASPGSGIDLRAFQEDLTVLLPVLAERPGSVLRVTGLTQDPSDRRVLGEVRSTTPSRPARRTVMAHERRFVAESTERLVTGISAYFSEARLTRSLIAESLGRALLATVPTGTRRILVVATDGAEESDLGRFEAPRLLPTAEAFLHRLETAGILLPSSACGTLIVFTHMRPRQGSAALRRYDSIKALWTAAVTRAGGHVTFTTDSITNDTLNQ